jgi:signal transduction histidine kinase/ActR/RegA family two-component response regulator
MNGRRNKDMLAMNEALLLGALRQHKLIEAADAANAQLQKEIAARRLIEAALRESETRLRDLNHDLEKKVLEGSRVLGHNNLVDALESLDHELVLYDTEDRLVLFNKHLYAQYPLADEHFVIGRSFEQIFRDLVDSGATPVPLGQTKAQFIVDRMARHIRADGVVSEAVQLDGRILHVSEHRSQSHGVVSISRDVTRSLKIADQLRESQKIEAIGRLTGGLAHDLNNYLSVIIGNLDLLSEGPFIDAETPKIVEGAMEGALRGAELTTSLLAFSRRQPLDPKTTNVGVQIAAITNMLGRTIGENIVLTLSVETDLWRVKIDGAQFDTCIVNLANNARDAMPRGGELSITVSNLSSNGEFSAEDSVTVHEHVLIVLSDTGIGMTADTQKQIFEPFFTTKGPGHGTGLGLSMVHGFVHQSGGTIRVKSALGKGTTVQIYLPRTLEEEVDRARLGRQTLPGGHERILLVEDNEYVRVTTTRVLSSLGYTVVAAESGDAALALLELGAERFDLLFTDIMMPGTIKGLELARLVLDRWPAVRVLVTSGFSDNADTQVEETRMRLTVLRKPYRKARLARAIRRKLDRRNE